MNNNFEKEDWLSMSEAAQGSPYSGEYLSLLARKGKLPAKKIRNIWCTTRRAVEEYTKKRELLAQIQKEGIGSIEEFRKSYLPVSEEKIKFIDNWQIKIEGYEPERFLNPPVLSKRYVAPSLDLSKFLKESIALSFGVLTMVTAGLAVFEYSVPQLASPAISRLSSANLASPLDAFLAAFKNLKEIAFDKIFLAKTQSTNPKAQIDNKISQNLEPKTKNPEPASRALTQSTPAFSISALKSDLQSELERYIDIKISSLPQSLVVYSTQPVINTEILRKEILLADTRPTITRQSNSDVDHVSRAITNVTTDGTLTNPTISGATITTSTFSGTTGTFTNLTVSGTCTGCGASFPFTTTSYGVSTSTIVAFTNGFLSTASSTIDSAFLVTGSTTLQNFTFSTATGTSATTTNFFSTTASSTNLFFTTGSGGNFTSAGLGTFSSLLLNGSSTLQNFTFVNATGTSATTTNFFATTASSTNLFSSTITAGSLTSSGDLVFSGNNVIRRNTSDGADNGLIKLSGGGAADQTRGAFIDINGNEASNSGDVKVWLGNVAGSDLEVVNTAGNAVLTILGSNGQSAFTSTLQSAMILNSTHTSGGGTQYNKSGTNVLNVGAGTWVSPSADANDGGVSSPNGDLYLIAGSGALYLNSLSDVVKPITDNEESLGQTANRWTTVYAANGTINTSDARLKTNVTNSDLGLDFVKSLRPVSYRWIDKDNGTHYGLIAQEVREFAPSDSNFVDGTESEGWLGMNYSEYIAPLIKAVQEIAEISGSFKTALIAWLADAANGIGDFFAEHVRSKRSTTELLCVADESGSETCLTKSQVDSLLANSGSSGTVISYPTPSSEPSSSATSTPNQSGSTPDGTGQADTTSTEASTETSTSTPETTTPIEEPAPATTSEPSPSDTASSTEPTTSP